MSASEHFDKMEAATAAMRNEPDENREVDPEAVIDDITSEVLNVVSPEGHYTEEWQQVRDAVAKGIEPLLPNHFPSSTRDNQTKQ